MRKHVRETMAKLHFLRRLRSGSSGSVAPASLALLTIAGAALLLTLAAALAFSLTGLFGHAPSTARVVETMVGKPTQSPLVTHRGTRVTIGVAPNGVVLRNRGANVLLSLDTARSSAWARHATGASRRVDVGTEVLRFGLPASEEYLVVDHHLGRKTLKWNLSPGVRPILHGDSIDLAGANLSLSPARFFDLGHKDITPAGTHWQVAKHGSRWQLLLTVDDHGLPARYIIDPTVTFRIAATPASVNATQTASVTLPASVASGDLIIVMLSINKTGSTGFTLSGGTSTACTTGATKFDETVAAANVTQILWWAVAGATDASKTCVANWTGAGEVVMYAFDYTTGTYYTSTPVDFGALGSAGTTASATYTSNNLSTFFYNEFLAMAATEDANKAPQTPSPGTWTQHGSTINTSEIGRAHV